MEVRCSVTQMKKIIMNSTGEAELGGINERSEPSVIVLFAQPKHAG